IPAPSVERLSAVGKWMSVNAESIRGTTASPFKKLAWGRATQKPGTVYLQVYDWPGDGKLVVPLSNPVEKAYLLAGGDVVATQISSNGVSLKLPRKAADPVAGVVVLKIEGEPKVAP